MAYEFPYLALNNEVSSDQATMLLRSFAQQTILFEKLIDSQSTLSEFTMAAGLIGFTILVISWLLEKIELQDMVAWCLLFLITVTGYVGDTIFFTPLQTNMKWLDSPYCAIEGSNVCPPQMITGRKVLEEEGIKPDNAGNGSPILMFSPQIWAIHIINIMRAELAVAFDGAAREGLSTKFKALEMARSTNVTDYRPHYDMALFMHMCGDVAALKDAEGGWINSSIWINDKNDTLKKHDDKLYADLKSRKITFGDVLDAHKFFWAELDRVGRNDAQNAGTTYTPGSAGTSVMMMGLPPLIVSGSDLLKDECEGTFGTGAGSICSALSSLPLKRTVFYKKGDWNFQKFHKSYSGDSQRAARLNFNKLLAALGALDDGTRDGLRSVPIAFTHARISRAADGNIEEDRSWISKILPRDWTTEGQITDCAQFHEKVTASFMDAIQTVGDFNTDIGEILNKALEGRTDIRPNELPSSVKARIAYETIAAKSCDRDNDIISCGKDKQEQLLLLRNYIVASAMHNALPETEAILAEAARANGYSSGLRNIASELGTKFAPVAVFFQSLFGGFQAGTYSAIMPSLISWFIAMTIVATPLLFVIGLVIPQWATGVLSTPIIAVIYFKSVELSFILIKAIFMLIGGLNSKTPFAETNVANFHDILLGMAYTSAFAVSLVLLFGLRNPAGLVQGLAGKADSMAQISTQEALAVIGTAMAGAKVAGSFLPGGAALNAIGSVAGAVANTFDKDAPGFVQGVGDTISKGFNDTRQSGRHRFQEAAIASAAPRATMEDMSYIAKAHGVDAREKLAELAGKGMGVSGNDRKPKTYQERLPDGTLLTSVKDPANIQLGDHMAKELNISPEAANRLANALLSKKAIKTEYNGVDANNVPRQLQFHIDPTRGERAMRGLGDVDAIKKALGNFNK